MSLAHAAPRGDASVKHPSSTVLEALACDDATDAVRAHVARCLPCRAFVRRASSFRAASHATDAQSMAWSVGATRDSSVMVAGVPISVPRRLSGWQG